MNCLLFKFQINSWISVDIYSTWKYVVYSFVQLILCVTVLLTKLIDKNIAKIDFYFNYLFILELICELVVSKKQNGIQLYVVLFDRNHYAAMLYFLYLVAVSNWNLYRNILVFCREFQVFFYNEAIVQLPSINKQTFYSAMYIRTDLK